MFAIDEAASSGHDALPVCLWQENSNRLVSLWDMITTYGHAIAGLTSMLVHFEQVAKHLFERDEAGALTPAAQTFADVTFRVLAGNIRTLSELQLMQSAIYAERLLKFWEQYGIGYVLEEKMLPILHERIMDELASTFFMHLSTAKAAEYSEPRRGWEDVIFRFPSSLVDIEEMNRCSALSRYPAAVFHSVNAIEVGLIALGEFLGVSDPKSGWTAVCGKLEQLVQKTKYSDLQQLFQAQFPFLEQVHGTAVTIKNSWRNKISHTHGRLTLMTSEFTPEVAEEIILASRSFMRRLATELP